MLNWIRAEKADDVKYPEFEYIIETLYLNDDELHCIVVKQLIYGSYIYYYRDGYPRIKKYLEGKCLDEAKEIIVGLVKSLASYNIDFWGNVLSCLVSKE